MGLLDAFNSEDGKLGLAMLAAAQPSMEPMNFAGRMAMVGRTMQANKQDDLKEQLVKAQLGNYASEIEARKLAGVKDARQQAMIESLLGPMGGQSQAPAGTMQPPVSGMQNLPITGAPQQPGLLGTAQPGAPSGMAPVQTQRPNLIEFARSLGIPEEAIKTDMVFNGGKGIAEMMFKRGTPNMQVNGSYVYDANTVKPGFMPSLSTSQSGQTSMTRIGADGMPVVSAPEGALNTYRAYQNAAEGTKAAFDPLTITPPGGRPVMSTRGAVVQSMGQPNGDQYGILSQELAAELRKPNPNPEMIAGLQRELARLPKGSDTATSASGIAGIPLQSDAEKTKAVDTAKADVVRDTGKIADGKRYGQLTAGVDRAIELLKSGPTASGFGSAVDATQGFFGGSNKGADLASQLDTLSGWLTANVPRMEGPQSDKDVANYRIQAAAVGDRTKPISQRLAAANELKALQNKYAEMNGYQTPKGNEPNTPTPKVIDSLPTPNGSNKGQRMRDTTTGKIFVSNGLQWKPE